MESAGLFTHKLKTKTNVGHRFQQPEMQIGSIQLLQLQFMCTKPWCSHHLRKEDLVLTSKSWSYTPGAVYAIRLLQATSHTICLAIKCSAPLSAPSSSNCSLLCSKFGHKLQNRIYSFLDFSFFKILSYCHCQRWAWTKVLSMETLPDLASSSQKIKTTILTDQPSTAKTPFYLTWED